LQQAPALAEQGAKPWPRRQGNNIAREAICFKLHYGKLLRLKKVSTIRVEIDTAV